MPRVSIIIPSYNAEAYLAETLATVEGQTYDDWEVVVSDDCSTDGTVAAAQAFGERFTVLRGTSNAGPAAARNRALTVASGELVAFLDADDLWRPTYLETLVRLFDDSLDRGLRPGILACDARMLDPDGLRPQTYMEARGLSGDVTLSRMLVMNQIFGGAVSPRALVEEAGGFCPDLFGTEDYDLWLRVLELGYDAVVTTDVLAVYRQRSESVSQNSARMARSFQLTYRRAIERGRLTPHQERTARRKLRLHRAAEQLALIVSEHQAGRRPVARLTRHVPLFLTVAAENPGRWRTAAQVLSGRG